MRASLLLKKKIAQEVKTKFGPKTKYSFLVTSDQGKTFYVSTWANEKTGSWKEGETVEMDLTEREYMGKIYFDGKPYEPTITEVYRGIQEILDILKGKVATFDDAPPEYNPNPDGDVPF